MRTRICSLHENKPQLESRPLVTGILSRLEESDQADMKAQGYRMISIVVCNLYPFSQTVARPDVTLPEAIEQIDIGKQASVCCLFHKSSPQV